MTLCIAGGRVLRPDRSVERADVLVDPAAGEVIEVAPGLSGDERLDATGALVAPGLVNAHTHVSMTLLRGYADDLPLETWLREAVWPAEGAMTEADIRAGARLAAVEMIRSGTTAFADMYFHEPAVADVVVESGLRARLGHGIVTVGKDERGAAADVAEGVAVVRELRDRHERVSTMVCPHSLTTVGEEYLREAVAAARDLGVPVHVHANETDDEVAPIVDERGQRPLEYAREVGLLEDGDFLAHGVHLSEGEVETLAETGAGVVHCPASNMKLASGTAPVQRLLDAGATVGLGTDGAASNNDLDLLGELRDAALLGKLAADDASAVAAPDAVRMATEGSARAAGLPVGRVEAGAPADLAVVSLEAAHLTPAPDDALVSHLAYAATGADVRHTVVDGQVLLRDGAVTTLDAAAVRREAEERARTLRDRAGGA